MESVLVLEDDDNFRALLSETLSDAGYRVTEAASAEEAIACARRVPFHLVLSDVRMAGALDGVGAIEQSCVPLTDQIDNHPAWGPFHLACSPSVPELYAILNRMAHPDPALRYPSLDEVISHIDQVLRPRPLGSIIPAEGLPPQEAWKLLRPLFVQIEAYHRQGIVSGSFDVKSIEVTAEGDARIAHFSPDKSLEHIERSKRFKRQSLNELFALPNEIALGTVQSPQKASDQPPLGRIFAQVLGGPSRQAWYQPLLLHTDDESSWLELHTPFFQELAPCICRLTRPDPAERFPQITDAIEAFDRVFNKDHCKV